METEVSTVEFKSFEEYEEAFDQQWQQNTQKAAELVEGFMKTGYLLKKARDTDILKDTEYTDYLDFAKKKYDIGKDVVSRYININNTFSEGGNSMRLKEKYRGFGYAKLALMLTMPEEIREEITAEYSKSEIQTIKEEVEEEKKVTDLEVMIEREPELTKGYSIFAKAVLKLFEINVELYREVHKAFHAGGNVERNVYEAMAPADEKMYIVRVQGVGKLIMRISKGMVSVRNTRDAGEHVNIEWERAVSEIQEYCIDIERDLTAEENWQVLYGREFPEVAPVQPSKAVQRKESKVYSAKEPKKTEKKESVPAAVTEPAQAAVEEVKKDQEVQQEENEHEKVDETTISERKIVPVEDKDKSVEISAEREIPPVVEPDGSDSRDAIKDERKRFLRERIEEVVKDIENFEKELAAAVRRRAWNAAKSYMADIKDDIERIEKLETEIENMDVDQIEMEDLLHGEEG